MVTLKQVLRATSTVSFILNEVMLKLCHININAYKLPSINSFEFISYDFKKDF